MRGSIKWILLFIVLTSGIAGCDKGTAQENKFVIVPAENVPEVEIANVNNEDTELEKYLRGLGLVDIAELDSSIAVHLVYATDDNFTGQRLYYDLNKAFMLPETAKRLMKAQQLLKEERPDLTIIVFDAVRPMSVQQIMWEQVEGTPEHVYVSNPAKGGGLHNYGAALDLSIIDSMGNLIPMGSPYDFFGNEARVDKEDWLIANNRITQEELHNRRLLRKVMKEAGFIPLHSEWWHFNLMSRKEAIATLKLIE